MARTETGNDASNASPSLPIVHYVRGSNGASHDWTEDPNEARRFEHRETANWVAGASQGRVVEFLDFVDEQASLLQLEGLTQEMLLALRAITDHFSDVLENLAGVEFEDGVKGIPTIKAARAAIRQAELLLGLGKDDEP